MLELLPRFARLSTLYLNLGSALLAWASGPSFLFSYVIGYTTFSNQPSVHVG